MTITQETWGGIAPTMSKLGLLLKCQWPWNRPEILPIAANEPMRYGSAFHGVMQERLDPKASPQASARLAIEKMAKDFDVEADEIAAHATDAFNVLDTWLRGDNPWKKSFLGPKTKRYVEQAIAYNPRTNKARFIPPPDERHQYAHNPVTEIPGTVDLAVSGLTWRKDTVLILDHKTGMFAENPGESDQLHGLALAFCRLLKAKHAIVAIFHAPRRDMYSAERPPAQVFADELSVSDLEDYRHKLIAAMARVGDGSLTPGSHCQRCHGIVACPLYAGGLVAIRGADGKAPLDAAKMKFDLTTHKGLTEAHEVIKAYDKAREAVYDAIKQRIVEHGPAVRSDGRLLAIVTSKRKNLSQASILRAYGAVKGAKEIARLAADGAIEEVPRQELRVVNDDGG